MFEQIKMKAMNTMVVATANAGDAGASITQTIQWLITVGGLFMAVWGVVQLTQSGRANDSQGKMEASWLLGGGICLMAIGAGTLITGVLSNPPGS